MSAVDEYGPVIDTIYRYAQSAGLTIDTVIQEDGAGQVEINLTHGDPILLADQVFYFKRIIREAALNHGMFATFMAKPMRDQPGSAMHIHQSVIDLASGASLACGYLGMLEQTRPGEPAAGEVEDGDYPIPTTIDEALTLFEQAEPVHRVLGLDFCMVYSEVKREEMRQFHREISPWEREHLLLNV
jgi:glutamine synthetase